MLKSWNVRIGKHHIGTSTPCYLVAEISHNHQGSAAAVKKLVAAAAKAGASAVKFQKRDNATLFLPEYYSRPYTHADSFGTTYGRHREYLEPKMSWLQKANEQAHAAGIHFIMTVFDVASLELCEQHLHVDAYKIQSADLTSHYLIEQVARIGKPYFISCGAATLAEIESTYKYCASLCAPFCLMYAVSEYPTQAQNVNLRRISQLRKTLKADNLGFSCHYMGLEPVLMARTLGAIAIEKHFTLDKTQKGPDHKLSVTPDELMMLRARLTECDSMLGKEWISQHELEPYQADARYKMGKCAIAVKALSRGHILQAADVRYVSPMAGPNPAQLRTMFGKPLKKDIKMGEVIK